MDARKQVEAFGLIESLVNDGHTMTALPINRERAEGIINLRIEATEQDIALLEQAGARATTTTFRK